ncbi:protein encore isoform X1 [Aedes albopictus]|uniref:Encore protein n=1 Tax=Aedes albopictus TaxID=7160 RepID=A0ABM1YP39_AEDAL
MSTGPAQVAVVLPNNNNNCSNSIGNKAPSVSTGSSGIGSASVVTAAPPPQPPSSSPSSSAPSTSTNTTTTTSTNWQSCPSSPTESSSPSATCHSSTNNNNNGCNMATVATAAASAATTTTAVSSVIASPVSPALSSSSTNAQKQELTTSLATGSATAVDHPSSQVTSAAPPTSTATLADPLNRPTSLGGRQRTLGGKGKHLTRSHAMRESTSPPRTPTPRSPSDQQNNNSSSNGSPSQHQQSMLSINATSSEPPCIISSSNSHSPVSESRLFNNNNNNDYGNKQTCSNSPNIVVYGGDERGGKSQLDLDFPKLTPPKSSYGPNGSNGGNNGKNSNGRNNGTNSNSKSDSDKQGKNADLVDQQKELKQQAGPLMLDCCGDQSVKTGLAVSTPAIIPNNTSSSSPVSSNNNYCDNENRNLREVNFSANSNDSNNQINIQFSHEENRYIQCESPTDSLIRNNSSSNGNLNSSAHNNKKHRGAGGNGGGGGGGAGGGGGGGGNGIPVTGKGNKPRLKNMSGGSSSSMDGGGGSIGSGGCGGGMGGGGGGSSSFLSRDNSCEQFTDQSGVNLIQFFKETLNKNFKDRNMLMKIEKELLALAMDRTRSQIKFPPMSSYNRMLIHRVAAYFGMEHNVDATQQSVIAEVTSATRIPEIRFKTLINESFSEEPRKSILKRDTHSFDEYRYGLLHCPDRGILDRKAKSFEEREEEYDKVKRRIFKNREDGSSEEHWQWMSTDNPEPPNGRPKLQNNRLLKVQSVSIEGRSDERPCVSKSHSFGGYGGSSQNAPLLRGDSITSTKSASGRLFTKQDSNASTNTPWRLSPSSSGSYFTFSYKTQSIRSDSVTPSPTGYGSGDHTPEPCIQSPSSTCGVVWAVTDMASVPKGSVLIDPQTLQPIVNQDGSIYHFDPSNLPATANLPGSVPRVQKKKFEKQKSFSSRNNLNSSSSLESSIDLPLGNKNDCGQQTTINNNATTTIAEEIGSELIYDGSTSTIKITTKDSHDIDDSSLCEEISQTTNELGTLKLQKHQATSPMLQASELQPLELNEIQLNANHEHGALSEAVTPLVGDPETGCGTLMVVAVNSDTSSVKHDNQPEHQQHGLASDDANDANSEHSQEADKKDETGGKMNAVQTVPLVSYSNSATPNSAYTVNYENGSGTPGGVGTTVYASGAPGMSTTYQTAPDGTIYAVPSPLVYTYPSAMDPEMSGYFVPVYDQQRDPSMCTAAGTPVYQAAAAAAGAASTVLPIAYTPTAAYSGAPLYQNPTAVMYSSEQFPTAAQATAAAAAAASAGPLPQYPIGYPIGIGYPFNSTAYQNYWNQPITYYVPQTPVPSAGSTPIIMPPPQTPTNSSMMSATSMHGKRNTTPPNHGQQSQNQGQSASVTPVPISPFATNIPMPLPDPNAGPMYAIPQPIYSNMLPFTGPMNPHPHHPSAGAGGGGTIVNSVLPTATAAAAIGYHHHPHSQSNQGTNMDSLPSSNGSASNIYSNPSQNNAQTPQSTPSTPLSLPLSLPPHGKNPPLFATPPILPNGYNPQMGSASGGGSGAGAGHHHYNPSHSYEDRKSSGSSGGYQGKRSNANSGNYFNYSNNNNSRQMTPNSVGGGGSGASNYQNQGNSGTNGGPKSYTNSNNTGNNQNSNTGGPLMLGQPPKGRSEGQTTVTKPPLIPTLPNNNNNSTSSNTNPSDKTRINRSSKPPNLDLKRSYNNNFNVNSRNTPSTNSTESNNSPNSITSSSVHEHHPSQHHHHHHPQSQSHHPFGHGTSGSAAGSHHAYYPPQQQQQQPAYYHHSQQRGGSVGSNNGGGGGGAGGANVNASAGGAAMSSSATIQSAAAVAAAACAAAAIEPYHHSQLIPLNATGMSYVKIGQTYFTHPSLALPPSRRSPPNDIRPIAGVYPAMNMVMPASRQFTPRPQHSGGYKGNKAPR